jgi:hypothetical protein
MQKHSAFIVLGSPGEDLKDGAGIQASEARLIGESGSSALGERSELSDA